MNICSNKECMKKLFRHNIFCYKCGFKSTNPIINSLRPILKRTTHIYCHSCIECIEMYGDDFCRNCGIRHLSYGERNEINYFFLKNQIRKDIKKNNKKCEVKNIKK